MSASFDLIEREWVPCILADGSREEFGLLKALVKAHEIREIHDASPLVTAALHRLLLAILHRNFGPENPAKWRELWKAGSFDQGALQGYFAECGRRFDLLDREHPFYQDPSLPEEWMKPVSVLQHDISASSSSPLFTHDSSRPLPAAVAARAVVAQQAYALGGTLSREKGAKSGAQGGRLVPGAMIMLTGESLFETLMLNMMRYSVGDDEPSGFRQTYDDREPDVPVWEASLPTRYEARPCRGYLDYLTWQMRRIKLSGFASDGKYALVRQAALAGGWEFTGDFRAKDPAVAYRLNKPPKSRGSEGNQPWVPWKPKRGRVLWRDCNALLRSFEPQPDGGGTERPAVVGWVSGLHTGRRAYSLDIYGVWHESRQQVRIYFWRHERLPLPAEYLENEFVVDALRECLQCAEGTAGAIQSAVRTMAREIEAPGRSDDDLERPENRKLKERVERRARTYAAESVYWASLEVPFRELVLRLPEAVSSGTSEGQEIPEWSDLVDGRATEAFDRTILGLGLSSANMRAAVKARGRLQERRVNGRR